MFPEDHHAFIENKKKEYKTYDPVFSPALNGWIHFNADGFYHLQHKANGTPRKMEEQIYKVSLLPFVIPVIARAMIIEKSEMRIHGYPQKIISYWSVVANVGKKQKMKVRVVIRKTVNQTKYYFWSVMRLK